MQAITLTAVLKEDHRKFPDGLTVGGAGVGGLMGGTGEGGLMGGTGGVGLGRGGGVGLGDGGGVIDSCSTLAQSMALGLSFFNMLGNTYGGEFCGSTGHCCQRAELTGPRVPQRTVSLSPRVVSPP